MRLTLDPVQVFAFAFRVLTAARAPASPRGIRTVEDYTEVFQGYEDAALWITTSVAIHGDDGRLGVEISIHRRANEKALDGQQHHEYETVFIASLFGTEADGHFEVRLFEPGPWYEHLESLAQRAAVVIQARTES